MGAKGTMLVSALFAAPRTMAVRWPSSKLKMRLRGSNAGRVIEFKLTDDATFDLRRVAVRSLAFAVTQLVGNVRGGRGEADGGQNDGDFPA